VRLGRAALCAALGALALAGPARADALYVICHPSVVLSEREVRDVFLGDRQFAAPIRLAPADNRAAHAAFLQKVLKMAFAKYATAWTKKSFRDGVIPPPVKASDVEAIEYVRGQFGSCSYATTAPGPGVRVILNSGP
jgi:hypothetical protein